MSTTPSEFKITFDGPDLSSAQAGVWVSQLKNNVQSLGEDVKLRVEKKDQTTQDLGTTLVLLFGTPAAIALAKGVADYLRSLGDRATITIHKDGRVVAERVSGRDAAKIAAALSK